MARNTAKIIPLHKVAKKQKSGETVETVAEVKDAELVIRSKKDDQKAIETLIRRYQNKVYGIAFQMSQGDEDDAQEITQEAFFRAFKSIKKFKGKSSFYTWLYRIVVNTCLDARKRRWRKEKIFFLRKSVNKDHTDDDIGNPAERLPDTGNHSDPLATLSAKELNQQVQESMKMLPEKQRLAFHLKVNQNMSIREIAQVMGSAEGTVKSHLFRAIKFMRRALKEWL